MKTRQMIDAKSCQKIIDKFNKGEIWAKEAMLMIKNLPIYIVPDDAIVRRIEVDA